MRSARLIQVVMAALAVLQPHQPAAVDADPQRPRRVLGDRLHGLVTHRLDVFKNLPPHAVQTAAVRADPKISLTICHKRKDVIVRQPVFRVELFRASC